MQLAIPRWKGLVSAFAWVTLSVALWCTIVAIVSVAVRAANGSSDLFSLVKGRGPAEIALAVSFASLPAIVGLMLALAAQRAIGHRQAWLVRVATANVLVAITLSLIA